MRKPTKEEKDKIYKAVGNGNVHTLQELASSGVDITGILYDGENFTALHYAANECYNNIITYLISQGARVDDVDYWLWTPLHCAARWGHTDCVALLVASGANIYMKDREGRTPLELAVDKSRHRTVQYFIKQLRMDITSFNMVAILYTNDIDRLLFVYSMLYKNTLDVQYNLFTRNLSLKFLLALVYGYVHSVHS